MDLADFLLLLIILGLQVAQLALLWPHPEPPPAPVLPPVLPEDWDALLMQAFADCGLGTHLAHAVLAAVIKRADLKDVQTFADLKRTMETVARAHAHLS